ncbi:AIM24 family protein [Nocardioides litoris]|uniref:AIM24 family protein n=1 Tax=Nocardioides litoris TaxID=1926648 RepID=UPI00112396C5|nr:AIM24 family protein [Nocardioides litoris]
MVFEQLNKKVVRTEVRPGGEVIARRGAMLGYSGGVSFRPIHGGGGVGGMVGRAMSGESVAMMVAEGQGTVLYGFRGLYVTVIQLANETLTVEADRLLAHDAHLSSSIEMIGSGGVRQAVRGMATGQGLFTTKLSGQGTVAVLSHGGAFEIPVNGDTVGVDPQAYVGHVGALNVDFRVSAGIRDVVGRGSGEATQLHVTGHGRVYVQASEQKFS